MAQLFFVQSCVTKNLKKNTFTATKQNALVVSRLVTLMAELFSKHAGPRLSPKKLCKLVLTFLASSSNNSCAKHRKHALTSIWSFRAAKPPIAHRPGVRRLG